MIQENEIHVSVIRDRLYFPLVNCARDPMYDPLTNTRPYESVDCNLYVIIFLLKN